VVPVSQRLNVSPAESGTRRRRRSREKGQPEPVLLGSDKAVIAGVNNARAAEEHKKLGRKPPPVRRTEGRENQGDDGPGKKGSKAAEGQWGRDAEGAIRNRSCSGVTCCPRA
jgi:hypothetical protein